MVERPELLSETQNGPVELKLIPQGLIRLGSVLGANPDWSAVRNAGL